MLWILFLFPTVVSDSVTVEGNLHCNAVYTHGHVNLVGKGIFGREVSVTDQKPDSSGTFKISLTNLSQIWRDEVKLEVVHDCDAPAGFVRKTVFQVPKMYVKNVYEMGKIYLHQSRFNDYLMTLEGFKNQNEVWTLL
ncbi:unnamed protein product [Caenorhabditis angaria]|uniref:Uncharacterized protein n=1 Tax=Caenorhabditis angaria TaxID=860376 RepID=A0A9P1ILN4_9PELO|nr:unnamed protein product [Caenorhabditis angaria]